MGPYQIQNQEDNGSSAGSAGTAVLFLGLFTLLYLIYENLDKKILAIREMYMVNESRFHVVEDKLATLEEVEKDVEELKEEEEERKNSWEDDVTEPGKYQAILGTGTVDDVEYEFRFVREKLDTFKSNRYWLLNDISTNEEMIQHFLEYNFQSYNFSKKGDKYVSTHLSNMAVGLDSLLYLECSFTGSVDGTGFNNLVVRQAKTIQGGTFKWKRALVDVV